MSRGRARGPSPAAAKAEESLPKARGLAADLPLPLQADAPRGPWAKITLLARDPRMSDWRADAAGREAVDATVEMDPAPGTAGSARLAPAEDGPLRLLASPPAWPGRVPDLAPGAPAGDDAAFGQAVEDVQLASCYAMALAMAEQHGASCVAFASLGRGGSDGLGGFPGERAAKIALGHAIGHLARRPPPAFPTRVVFLVSDEEVRLYRGLIDTRERWAAGRRRA